MDEIIHERRHVDKTGISPSWVGEVLRLDGEFYRVDKSLYVGQLLFLQVLFLWVYARPHYLAGYETLSDSRHFRRERGIVLIIGIYSKDISSCQFTPFNIRLFQF